MRTEVPTETAVIEAAAGTRGREVGGVFVTATGVRVRGLRAVLTVGMGMSKAWLMVAAVAMFGDVTMGDG